MDSLEKLEDLETKTIEVIDTVGEMMRLLGLELKQESTRNEIQGYLLLSLEQIQGINEELHDIIDNLP